MGLFRRFKHDRRGVSAIEFAFIAPILIIIYFSVAELCQAMLAQRKVAHAASAVGDLVAQLSTTNKAGLADVLEAANTVVAPFPSAPLQIQISSVSADANDNTTVAWGYPTNNSGTAVVLPPNLITANQTVIKAEVTYTYNSPFQYLFKNAIVFDQVFYLRPRLSTSVVCTDC